MSGKLIITVGIPGCGKSSWAHTMFPHGHIVSSDAIREELTQDANDQTRNDQVFNLFHARLAWGLCHGKTMVADSTALTRPARENLYSVAKLFNAEAHLVYFSNCGTAVARNLMRERVVPEEVMERMLDQYENFLSTLSSERHHLHSVTEIRSFG